MPRVRIGNRVKTALIQISKARASRAAGAYTVGRCPHSPSHEGRNQSLARRAVVFKENDMTHPNSPKGALLRHGYTLHKDPRYPHSERRTVKDSAGVVVLDDAPLDAVCDFCKRNELYLPE